LRRGFAGFAGLGGAARCGAGEGAR